MKSHPISALLLILLLLAPSVQAQRNDDHFIDPHPFTENPLDITPRVSAVAADGSVVVAYYPNNDPRGDMYIARWDGLIWAELSGSFQKRHASLDQFETLTAAGNGDVYAGGFFSQITRPDGTIIPCGNLARWDNTAAQWTCVGGGLDGSVFHIETLGHEVIAGGSFLNGTNGDGTTSITPGIARYDLNTQIWATYGQGLNNSVSALTFTADGSLYAGGAFDTATNADGSTVTVNHFARWNASANLWEAVGDGFFGDGFPAPFTLPRLNGIVADAAGNVYVGGFADTDLGFRSLTARNTDGTVAVGMVLQWDGSRWTALAAGLLAQAVWDLVIDSNAALYIRYQFDSQNAYVGAWDGSRWNLLGEFGGELVYTIAANPEYLQGDVYVGGLFFSVTDGTGSAPQATVLVNRNTRYTGVWRPLIPQIGGNGIDGAVLALEMDTPFGTNYLAAGGRFDRFAYLPQRRVALHDGDDWVSMGQGVTQPSDAAVHTLAFEPNTATAPRVFVGGHFTEVMNTGGSAVAATNIAVYDIATDTWAAVGGGVDGPVYALAYWQDNRLPPADRYLYVGGAFSTAFNANGQAVPNANGIVRYNLTRNRWETLGEGVVHATPGMAEVRALAIEAVLELDPSDSSSPYRHDVFVGGLFDEALASGGGGGISGTVNIARFHTPSGAWHPVGLGTNGRVRALAYFRQRHYNHARAHPALNGYLYAGGDFTAVRDGAGPWVITNYLTKWSYRTDAWGQFGTGNLDNGTNGPVHLLRIHEGYSVRPMYGQVGLIVGGAFTQAINSIGQTIPANHIAQLLDRLPASPRSISSTFPYQQFLAFGSGANDSVLAATVSQCAFTQETMYFGGTFTQAAGNPAFAYLAKWRYVNPPPPRNYVNVLARCSRPGVQCSISYLPANRLCGSGILAPAALQATTVGFGETQPIPIDFAVDTPFSLEITDAAQPGTLLARIDSVTAESYFAEDLVLMGLENPVGYADNPDGLDTGLFVLAVPPPVVAVPTGEVALRFVNAVTDAPTVDVRVQGGATLVQDLPYSGTSVAAISLPPGLHTFEVVRTSDQTVLSSFARTLDGAIATLVLGGFLDPSANQDGPAMDLFIHTEDTPLPVALADFKVRVDGGGVVLTWITASETNNAGFIPEYRLMDDPRNSWLAGDFIEGHGTTTEEQAYAYQQDEMAPGRYHFRLRQLDFDGTTRLSEEVEVTVGLPGVFRLSAVYPNPFNPQAAFTLAVQRAQSVRITVYDLLGRQVSLLHDGLLEAHRTYAFPLDGTSWASGAYLIRIAGETFSATRRVVLVK